MLLRTQTTAGIAYLEIFEHNNLAISFQNPQNLAAFGHRTWPRVDLDVHCAPHRRLDGGEGGSAGNHDG